MFHLDVKFLTAVTFHHRLVNQEVLEDVKSNASKIIETSSMSSFSATLCSNLCVNERSGIDNFLACNAFILDTGRCFLAFVDQNFFLNGQGLDSDAMFDLHLEPPTPSPLSEWGTKCRHLKLVETAGFHHDMKIINSIYRRYEFPQMYRLNGPAVCICGARSPVGRRVRAISEGGSRGSDRIMYDQFPQLPSSRLLLQNKLNSSVTQIKDLCPE